MLRLIFVLLLCLASVSHAAEDPNDTYLYRSDCPAVGGSFPVDTSSNFYKCQCTSYVAHKLNEKWGNSSPRFTNQYYGFTAWSDAKNWRNRSDEAEIGVTGANDNFHWDERSYNAVFHGDVAWWDKWDYIDGNGIRRKNDFGHVAFVESATHGPGDIGVQCVTVSEYNFSPSYEYSRRTICKGDGKRFPDYFLHIDQDRIYCLANPTVGSCTSLIAGQQVANGPGSKVGGIGGGSDMFNLKLDFDIMNPTTGGELIAGTAVLKPLQVVNLRVQLEAVSGDVRDHMHPNKDTIETDFYIQLDSGEWTFLKREYTQASNLGSGTHTETVQYTIPQGASQVSFKVKIDAEDEVYESNEGDNWSRIETFQVDNFSWLIPILNLILED